MRVLVFILLLIGTASAQPMRFFTGAMGQYSPIVKNGLVCWLDGGNSVSANGVSNTWLDLSGNSNNISLSGNTFSTSYNGYFSFSSANNSLTLSGSGLYQNIATLMVWLYYTTSQYSQVIYLGNAAIAGVGIIINNGSGASGNKATVLFGGKSYSAAGSVTLTANTWYCLALSIANTPLCSFYSNTTLVGSTTTVPNGAGVYSTQMAMASQNFTGGLGQALIYNRALSSTEITQNYNATKGRYGY